jgi:hypothetical protein
MAHRHPAAVGAVAVADHHGSMPRRSRPNRSRQTSSLAAMKIIQEEQHEEDHQENNDDTRTTSSLPTSSSSSAAAAAAVVADRKEEMLWMARRLRRAKRSLLLKSVEAPSSPVDKFRSIVIDMTTTMPRRHLPTLPFKPTITASSLSRSAAGKV